MSKGRTGEASKSHGPCAQTAIVLVGGAERENPIDEWKSRRILLVKPGGKNPVDGVVLDGHTAIEESHAPPVKECRLQKKRGISVCRLLK